MDSPTRYCPTPGSLSHSPTSSSPQTMPIMHPQHQQPPQQQHIHHSHQQQQQQHPGYYGHNQGHNNYPPPPPQSHSGYYQQHQTPVSGYYSQQQPQQNNHVPITTEAAPPVVTHPYQQQPQSQQGAAEWQQPVPQHYYHPQPSQSHPQQPPYPPASHSPYGYVQTQQQPPMAQHLQQQQQQIPMHNNHIQQQQQQQQQQQSPIPQPGQHALLNLSRFVNQSSSPSPSPNNIPIPPPGAQIMNGNSNVVCANSGNEGHSPPRPITSPSGSCTNGQMIPVRLQMGKGQARTKANMRKLAMLEQQNSSNPAMQPITTPEPPTKKPEKVKTPRKRKAQVEEEMVAKTDVSKGVAAVLADLSTSAVADDLSLSKKRRSRKPKEKEKEFVAAPPTKTPRKNAKKTLVDQLPVLPPKDEVVTKSPRKPRKKKESLAAVSPIAPVSISPERQLPIESIPLKTTPRGRKKKSSSFNSESLPLSPNDSTEKEYTLQIPEVNDLPVNNVKVVQTMKPLRVEKKTKAQIQAEFQERKAILAEEVAMAQVLLDLKGGPSPLKMPEPPRPIIITPEILPVVHEIKVNKPEEVKEKKPNTPKENKGSKRKKSVDVKEVNESPVQSKRRRSVDKKEIPVDPGPGENSVQSKRRKSLVKEEMPVDMGESPVLSKRRKSVDKNQSPVEPLWNRNKAIKKESTTPTKRKKPIEMKEVSLAELKKQKHADAKGKRKSEEIVDKIDATSTPKVMKLGRSPKSVPQTKPFTLDLSFIPVAEQNEIPAVIKTPKNKKPRKMSKSPRASLDSVKTVSPRVSLDGKPITPRVSLDAKPLSPRVSLESKQNSPRVSLEGKPNNVAPAKSTTPIVIIKKAMQVETNASNSLLSIDKSRSVSTDESLPVTKSASNTSTVMNNGKKRKLRKKKTNLSASFNSADSVILDVSKNTSAPFPDTGKNNSTTAGSVDPIVLLNKETINKKASKSKPSLIEEEGSNSPPSYPKIDIPLEPKSQQYSFPFTSKRLRKKSIQKDVPKLPKPEPFQLNPKPIPVPTVFIKSTLLGNEAGNSKESPDKKEKRIGLGPSLKVVAGKVKFYRGSDEEDNETEPKLPKEKVPVQFDESVPWICVFCQLGPQCQRLGDLFGPYFVNNEGTPNPGKTPGKRETWMHEDCAVWAHNVLLIGSTLQGLDEAVYFADREKCDICGLTGATVGCLRRGCTKTVHVPCAKTNSWKMEISKMHSFCPEHV